MATVTTLLVQREETWPAIHVGPAGDLGGDCASDADGMWVECAAKALSSLPDGALAVAGMGEERGMGQNLGRVAAALPRKTPTTVVLILPIVAKTASNGAC
ncbi:MAG: hypothetical protein OHK0015_22760 [Chloroflexi bacterium OHK40]